MPLPPPPDDDDDGFDDDASFVNDRFDVPPPGAIDPVAAPTGGYGADPYGVDPYTAEPVLVEEGQNVPSSYNVRNILLLALGGFVLLLIAFVWSLDRNDRQAQADPEVQTAFDGSPGAGAPDALLGASSQPADDDLAALLNDPSVANGGNGGYGAYSEPAPPPPSYSSASYSDPAPQASPSDGQASSSGGFTGPREPTYYDRRREVYYASLGLGSREAIGARGAAPAGYYGADGAQSFAQGGYAPAGYGTGAAGPDAYGAYGSGNGQSGYGPEGYGASGLTLASAAAGAGANRPPASGSSRSLGPPSLAPPSGVRQAATSANAPFAPFTLAQGTLVPVVLETAVSSDIQGVFIARTVEDVYDRTRRHVLIPRGSQVVSSYQGAEVIGDRLQASASRLNLPDGRSVDFGGTGLFDSQGRVGLRDRVDRHTASRIGAGALLTLVGVGASVAQRRANRDVILVPNADGTVTQVPVGNDIENEVYSRGAQGAQQAISERAGRVINRPNTITLRPGLRGTLILQQDVDMRQPYYPNAGGVPVGRSPFDTRVPRPSPVSSGTRTAAAPTGGGAPTRAASARRP